MTENENILNGEITEEEPQVHFEEKRICKYCGRELNAGFDFCTYCGKSQLEETLPAKPVKDKANTPPVIKAKKKNPLKIVLLVLSLVSFGIAAFFFVAGSIAWGSLGALNSSGNVFGNLFGSTDVSVFIIVLANIVASYLSALFFMLAGIVLLMFRK